MIVLIETEEVSRLLPEPHVLSNRIGQKCTEKLQ